MHTVQDDRAEASDSGVELVRSLIIALLARVDRVGDNASARIEPDLRFRWRSHSPLTPCTRSRREELRALDLKGLRERLGACWDRIRRRVASGEHQRPRADRVI